ncbi:MAG: hypothetical protein WBA74_12635, partial [Cyclobacteriaceae bacterium]
KLTHYFNILDYNSNGFIEKDDFQGIGENLAILWQLKPGSERYESIINGSVRPWRGLEESMKKSNVSKASLKDWLRFADKYIVNSSDEQYEKYIKGVVAGLFGFFDQNADSQLSLKEYIDIFMAFRIEVKYSAKAFVKLDINKDGMINKKELMKAVKEFFRSDNENDKGNWLFGNWDY